MFLNLFRLVRIDFRRANMLGGAARLRIQKRILVREIVKPALWNNFDDRQRLSHQEYRSSIHVRRQISRPTTCDRMWRPPPSPNQVRSRLFTITTPTVEPCRAGFTTRGTEIVGRWPASMTSHSGVATSCSRNFSFEKILSNASSACLHAVTGVRHSALFQNLPGAGRLRRKFREW